MPYYHIDTETLRRIMALKYQCRILDIDNISFEYTDAKFIISKYREHWELIVRLYTGGRLKSNTADIYRIEGIGIKFKRSEVD